VAAEPGAEIHVRAPSERNRRPESGQVERHLKSIHWGNQRPYQPDWGENGDEPTTPNEWLFSAVVDYGDHEGAVPSSTPDQDWGLRPDPFSSYRTGFDVRNYRRCQRLLIYHHFPDRPDVGADCLVRSLDLSYTAEEDRPTTDPRAVSLLRSVTLTGHRRAEDGTYSARSLPPVEFSYTPADLSTDSVDVDPSAVADLPSGLPGPRQRWMDLDGDGVSGVVTMDRGVITFVRNLSAARDRPASAPQEPVWLEAPRDLPTVPALSGDARGHAPAGPRPRRR